ncbi:MAG: tetratricopeptide repeat protein [Myxococcota bacterium]
MKVSCPSCQTNYNIDDKRIPAGGAKLKCARCQTTFPIKLAAGPAPSLFNGDAAVPLPGATPAPPTPPEPDWEEEQTRVGDFSALPPQAHRSSPEAVPLPGMSAASPFVPPPPPPSIPLPGAVAFPSRAGAIPLPGVGLPPPPPFPPPPADAIPLPGITAAKPANPRWDQESTRVMVDVPPPPLASHDFFVAEASPPSDDAVPLPGITAAEPASPRWDQESTRVMADVPPPPQASHDFFVAEASPPSDAVPLPGISAAEPAPARWDRESTRVMADVPPPPPASHDFFTAEASPSSAIPLPGAVDFSDFPAPPTAQMPSVPLPGAGVDDVPEAEAADFSEVPSGVRPPPSAAPLPPTDGFDFSDLPAPSGSTTLPNVPAVEEAPAKPGGFELTDLPPPAPAPAIADFGVEVQEPVPSANPTASFGEVDFSEVAPTRSSDALEFDPTARPKPQDDLEVDLSAPIPPPAQPQTADGLEMLDFIDSAAKENKTATAKPKGPRYQVRRRTGKVFGPFDEGVVVKMLEDGQLLGNEDVSTDGEKWEPIGALPAFQATIERLMETPSHAPTSQVPAQGGSQSSSPAQSQASMERLKQLYEGRMAAVAVVDGSAAAAQWKRRIPLIAAAVLVLLFAGAGVTLGVTTPYGFFALKLLFPAKVTAGTREFADLQRSQKALLADTFKSYQEARDAAASALTVKEYPEVRAVWCQAIYYLQRRYAAANPSEQAKAEAAIANIKLLGEKHPEVVKALAGRALTTRDVDGALLLLEDALARTENQKDLELAFLRAEAYAAKGQSKLAANALEAVLEQKPDSAKALHALGNLHQLNKDAQAAAQAYEDALKADPDHVVSAVELAALQLLIQKDVEAGVGAVDRALAEERRALLGPAELARAAALKAEALAMQFKPEEAITQFEAALQLDPASVFAKAGLAKVYLSQRQYEKALPLLEEASTKEPHNLEYTDGLLSALIATGKMSDALKQVEGANIRFPGNARIAFLYGRVADALDQPTEAASNYTRAANADPELVEANLYLARMYLRFRRLEEAKVQLEEARKKAPTHAGVQVGLGELALTQEDAEEAKTQFEAARASDPNLADAYLGLSRVALVQGRPAEAQEHVEKALSLDARLKDGRLQKGLVLWRLGKLDEAIAELEKAKSEDPKAANILITLGAVKLDKGDLAGAEASLLAAQAQDPSNAEAYFYVAKVKNKRAEHTQAIDNMKRALEYAPKRPAYHYQLGLIYRDARKPNEAMEEWRQTVELSPNHADALEALGQAHLDRGELDLAVAQFEAALEAAPGRARVMALVGDCHYQATKWNEAITHYRKALGADPSLTQVYYRMARAYAEQGKHTEAINWYRRATSEDKDNPMPWYYLGFAYKERRQKNEAIAAFQKYLEKKPDAEDKREIEDEIFDLKQEL